MWYRSWPIVKCPLDLWSYHEIIEQTRPTMIVETGTYCGGSALFLADQLEIVGGGEVISIDIQPADDLPDDDRIEFVKGRSSVDLRVLDHVKERVAGRKTMVLLDSDHSADHVLRELQLYSPLVSQGAYLIVEDTNPDAYRALYAAGHIREPNAGPAEALKKWQPTNQGFKVDERRERFLFSQNPGGYLKRKST
jgi:cephalosporin hydroxylase